MKRPVAGGFLSLGWVAFTPKGGCPLKQESGQDPWESPMLVAFTPKGGCPLKLSPFASHLKQLNPTSSIHPQGWVPIETAGDCAVRLGASVAFTPKGGCPLKLCCLRDGYRTRQSVAFTPKGGCPLKRVCIAVRVGCACVVAFTPKGGCPLKLCHLFDESAGLLVAFTPKGGCPLKRVGMHAIPKPSK